MLRGPVAVVVSLFLIMVLVMAALGSATGVWPPLMAVGSKSMQHNDTHSSLGIIDTGDVVLVDRQAEAGGLRTYLDSVPDGHQSFGELGDVIVYRPPNGGIPIIHRAICELVYNASSDSFDVPALATLPPGSWSVSGPAKQWWDLDDELNLFDVGYANVTVHIDLKEMLMDMGLAPHGGLVTMGDNNWQDIDGVRIGIVDQGGIPGIDEPISFDWIIGKVTREVPWVGTIRLWLTGTAPDYTPMNSVVSLFVALGCMIALPTITYGLGRTVVYVHRKRRRTR
jgi:signal peptidase